MILCSKISHMIEGDGDRHLVQMVLDGNGQTLGQLGDLAVEKQAEHELHEKMKTLFAERGGAWIDAVHMVMDDPKNAALKQAYAGFTQDRYEMERVDPDPDMTALQAGVEIDTRAKAYMHDHPETTYQAAMGFVLAANPELKATYEQCA